MGLSYSERVTMDLKLKDIVEVAKKAGIPTRSLKLYGNHIAKVSTNLLEETLKKRKDGSVILVTSITPTSSGEGKTVTAIGLSMALNRLNKKSIACISQAMLGPVFGSKGTASGGGYAQVVPAEDINLHLTGDSYAAGTAQNLCAAILDNSFFRDNVLNLDKEWITWKRVMDVSDRALRNITIGGGGKLHGVSRRSGIEATAASECMAILSLSKNFERFSNKVRPNSGWV